MVDFQSTDQKITQQSKELVQSTLPPIAETLFMGAVIGYAEANQNPQMMDNMMLDRRELPALFNFDPLVGPVRYKGDLNKDDIAVWGKEVIKGSTMPPEMRGKKLSHEVMQGQENDPILA